MTWQEIKERYARQIADIASDNFKAGHKAGAAEVAARSAELLNIVGPGREAEAIKAVQNGATPEQLALAELKRLRGKK